MLYKWKGLERKGRRRRRRRLYCGKGEKKAENFPTQSGEEEDVLIRPSNSRVERAAEEEIGDVSSVPDGIPRRTAPNLDGTWPGM